MTKTIAITIEIFDDTDVSEVESMIGDALDYHNVDCIYNVNYNVEDMNKEPDCER